MIKKFIISLILFLPYSLNYVSASEKPFVIYLLMWRGFTDAEKGFVSYLQKKKINFQLIKRDCEQNKEKIPGFIAEIKSMKEKPDLIYVHGSTLTAAIPGKYDEKNYDNFITDIPIVSCLSSQPVGLKVIRDFTTSKRNIAIVSGNTPIEPQFEAWKRYYGKMKTGEVHLAFLLNPLEGNSTVAVKDLKELMQKEKIKVDFYTLPIGPDGKVIKEAAPGLVEKIAQNMPDFLYFPGVSFLGFNTKIVTDAAKKHRVPIFSLSEFTLTEHEAMIGLSCRAFLFGELTGQMAEEILVNKKNPGELPIAVPRKYSFFLSKPVLDLIGDKGKNIRVYPPLEMMKIIEVIE